MIGDEDEKKYITIIKISLICFFSLLVTIFITFFIAVGYVNAEESISTVPLGYISYNNNTSKSIYSNNNQNYWSNWGRGYLSFSVAVFDWSNNQTEWQLPNITSIQVTSNNSIYNCTYGSVSTAYQNGFNYKGNIYSVMCDMETGSTGLQSITITMDVPTVNSYYVKTSDYMTFTTNLDINIRKAIETQTTSIGSQLQTIINQQISDTNSINTTITNVVNTNFNSLWTNIHNDLSAIANIIGNGQTAIINNQNQNAQQAHQDSQAINDSINSDSVDDPTSDLSQMESQMPTNSTISDLLTLPVRLFQNVINAIDGRCSPFSLGSLYGTNITLPCINLQNLIGSNLYGVIDVILSGIFVLSIRKKFVDIFENLTSLKNGGNELE